MILLPAIDLHQGKCVRLFRGDYDTAEVVAQDPVSAARRFQEQGARWLHVVDLDGAKVGKPANAQLVFDVVENTGLHVEVGGGIRDMALSLIHIWTPWETCPPPKPWHSCPGFSVGKRP